MNALRQELTPADDRRKEAVDEGSGVGAGPNPGDRLEYMADLILELKLIAEQSGLNALAVILDLAWAEACRQRDSRRG
jgi:hypothetical protein